MCDKCGCGGSDEKTFKEKVAEIIDAIRPNLQAHGGDIELIGVEEDNSVKVRLQGTAQAVPARE